MRFGGKQRAWYLFFLPATVAGAAFSSDAPLPLQVPNAEFRQGDGAPSGWRLTGNGRWRDRDVLEVTGSGSDSSFWRCEGFSFQPGRLYRFQARARRAGGSGSAITGPTFANRDQSRLTGNWQWVGHVFRVPQRTDGGYLRLGQWHATGAIQFDAVAVRPVIAAHRRFGAVVLGEGESIQDGQYVFDGSFSHEGSNYHRTLDRATASFNSDRWVFGSDSQVTYRFALPDREFLSGSVRVNVSYHVRGGCVVEASRDRQSWHRLAVQEGLGTATADLPEALLPASQLLVRIRPSDASSYFQVNRVEFRASVRGDAPNAVGQTWFADVDPPSDRLAWQSMSIGRDVKTGRDVLRVELRNRAATAQRWSFELQDPLRPNAMRQVQTVPAGQVGRFDASLPGGTSGRREVRLRVAADGQRMASARLTVSVPDFHRSDYGQRIAGIAGDVAVWWCDATHKVPRHRPVPEASGPAVCVEAARGDYEAAQVVLRPDRDVKKLTASAGPLVGPHGATIPADRIQILRVWYHFVHHPTDPTGLRDWWPDALPPLDEPIDVAGGRNQPLWVLIHVPADAAPGDYRGQIALEGEAFTGRVPLRLHVWDFALPECNHLETAFGLSVGDIFRYHGLKTEADKRRVLDLYFRSFAEHRISPYDPTPLDPIGVRFRPDVDPPRADLDFTAFDRAMARAIERYRFTGFRLPIQGMGGGTFHRRYPPRIGEYGERTPQYQAMFASYVGQLEQHLRQRGWLDRAYVYWFDEPAPRDYEFVAAGMERLKRYAPGLRRMLTEQPGDNALAGLVDIWCPVSFHYDRQRAEPCRARGERFWWYVCTGPKAPYCTLFIDHPATELRVWHWQTWQRGIVGTLVWRANYWTSGAAFPDAPQNPYEDPMGYVSGYSTPRGVRRYWGNGDGRFIYPPLAAAVPGKSGPQPVIAPPVSSIRWEMIREGVEDYEMLYLLRERIEAHRERLSAERRRRYEALLEVPATITEDMTTFTTDPEPIYRHRRAVAEAIEAIAGSRKPQL